MILADTSVWVDHFRKADTALSVLVADGTIWQHPFVTGELATGNLRDRRQTIFMLDSLPPVPVVTNAAFYAFLDEHSLAGTGIGFVDVHLLAAAGAMPEMKLWTRDRRLRDHAARLGMAYQE